MEDVYDKMEKVLLWALVGLVIGLMVFLLSLCVKSVFFNNKKEEIHTETIYYEDHKYVVFYDKENKVKHIEHSPECDCLTVDFD